MKVSVVIPAYNEEKYIGKCLESIISQTEKPSEIIVVDNNCTDKTAEIAKKYGAKIVKEEKQGMIQARGVGFDAAKFEIIARTDADTILPQDWIFKIKKSFKDPNLGALSGPPSFSTAPLVSEISRFATFTIFRIVGFMVGHPILLGPNNALRKSLWEKVKDKVCLSDREVHEDIDLAIHLGSMAKIKFDGSFTVITTRGRWTKIFTVYIAILIKMLLSHKVNPAKRGKLGNGRE